MNHIFTQGFTNTQLHAVWRKARFAGHETVNHSEGEYVNKAAGINGIEGFWEYAKERLLRYHGVSPANFCTT